MNETYEIPETSTFPRKHQYQDRVGALFVSYDFEKQSYPVQFEIRVLTAFL